jgi:signal transduction histidine kinase
MGITGMEERAAFVGGRIIVNGDNGFVIESIVPIRN